MPLRGALDVNRPKALVLTLRVGTLFVPLRGALSDDIRVLLVPTLRVGTVFVPLRGALDVNRRKLFPTRSSVRDSSFSQSVADEQRDDCFRVFNAPIESHRKSIFPAHHNRAQPLIGLKGLRPGRQFFADEEIHLLRQESR